MSVKKIISKVLEHEGGLVNDTADPGGLTKYGISSRSYPWLDIANLTIEDAVDIYRTDYWSRYRCHKLPVRLQYIYFDMCVNQGPGASGRVIQQAHNRFLKIERIGVPLVEDGIVGAKTIEAVQFLPVLAVQLCRWERYLEVIKDNPALERFKEGWFRRCFSVGSSSSAKK